MHKIKIGETRSKTIEIQYDVFELRFSVTEKRVDNLNYRYDATFLEGSDVYSVGTDKGEVEKNIIKIGEEMAIEQFKKIKKEEEQQEYELLMEEKKERERKKMIKRNGFEPGQEDLFGRIR